MKKYVLLLVAVGLIAHSHDLSADLARIVRSVKALKMEAGPIKPGSIPPGITPVPNSVTAQPVLSSTHYEVIGDPTKWQNPFVPVQSAAAPIMYETVSCANGLTELIVDLNDGTTANNWLRITFDENVLTPLTTLMASGMYIIINLQSYNGSNYVEVQLTDTASPTPNVVAECCYAMPSVPQGAPISGPAYAYLGFNKKNTLGSKAGMNGNQTAINWINLTQGCRVLYQYSAGVTTAVQGTTASTPPPAQNGVLVLAPNKISGGGCLNGPFQPNALPSTYTLLSTTPFSCQGGLENFNVGLTNANENCYLSFEFGPTIMGNPQIRQLMNAGMYINVSLQEAGEADGGKNAFVVQILDANQTLRAYGSYLSSTIGDIDHWNLALNSTDSNKVDGVKSLGYNKIPLNTTVLYQQLLTVSKPVGANPS
jgi:hypothetical protein